MARYGLTKPEAGLYDYGHLGASHYLARDILTGRWGTYIYRADGDGAAPRTFKPSDCIGTFETLRHAFNAAYDDAHPKGTIP